MKIFSVSPYGQISVNRKSIQPAQKVNFCGTSGFESSQKYHLSGPELGGAYLNTHISNYTKLFRNIKVLQQLPQMLKDKFPDGARIYDYGCSTGFEPESIVMSLFNKMTPEQVAKYMPIQAFDVNDKALSRAKSPYTQLSLDDKDGFCFFKNISRKTFYQEKIMSISEFEEYAWKAYGQKPSNPYSLLSEYDEDEIKDIKIVAHEKLPVLTENIVYKRGDIFEDLENKDFGKEPVVLFFRNASQFMNDDGQRELAEKMWKALPSGSVVVLGDRDIAHQDGRNLKKYLLEKGFVPVKGDYKDEVSETRFVDPLKNSMGNVTEATLYFYLEIGNADGGVETYCVQKP